MTAFVFKLGSLDLSQYVRVGPQDSMDPYGAGWQNPAFSDAAFSEGHPLLNTDIGNREQVWPLYVKGVGVAFTPDQIAGLEIWCKPESLGSNGSAVSSWTNSGSGAALAQATGANQPTVATSAIDGYSAVRFDGSNDFLSAAIAADASRTVFIVAKQASGAVGDHWLMQFGSANAIVRSNAGAAYTWNRNQATADVTIGGTTTNWNVIALKVTSAAVMDAYVNGGAATNFDPDDGVTTQTSLTIGASNTGTSAMSCDVAEVLSFDSALSDTDRLRVLGYLSAKYPTLGSFGTSPTGVATKDSLHTLVQQINREIAAPTSSPLRIEWKDAGATNSTFYDVTFARLDPKFNYRLQDQDWGDLTLRVWCAPPYGHTATERIIATAAGTAPGLTASLIGVASALVGDVAPQLRVTVNTSGEPVGAAGRGLIIGAPKVAGYVPFISAASFVNLHPSAGVFGASGAPGSQALYRQPFIDAGRIAQVGLGATMYAGRKRIYAAVLPAGAQVGMAIAAVDQAGNAGATAMAYRADGWQIVDLGVVNVATTTPTTTLNLYTDQPRRTLNDNQYIRPLATGAAASSIGAVAGVYVLPEDSQALIDTNAKTLARSFFGASGGATGFFTGFVGEVGETWRISNLISGAATDAIFNASGAYLTTAATVGARLQGNTKSADNFRVRSIVHLTSSANSLAFGGMSADGNTTLLARASPDGTDTALVKIVRNANLLGTPTTQFLASMVIASQAGMPVMSGNALIVDLERRDRAVTLNARWAHATGIAYIPSAGMSATVVPVACVAATSALINSLTCQPFMSVESSGNFISYLQFDGLQSAAQASESYRLTSVSGDVPLRSPITGSGPNVDLAGGKRGADLKITASTVGVTAVDWQLDGAPMNDPMGVEVRCRERFTYAR